LNRNVQPEILDTLPFDHPDAQQNRRDIAKFNWLQGNERWMQKQLDHRLRLGDRLLEIGAGSGGLLMRLWNLRERAAGVEFAGLDRCPRPSELRKEISWAQEDLLRFDGWNEFDVVIGNFILHQFSRERLWKIGEGLQAGPRLLVFNELHRSRWPLLLLRGGFLLGVNWVTRHDAAASVRAGFAGDELTNWLGMSPKFWRCRVTTGVLGQYRWIAERNGEGEAR